MVEAEKVEAEAFDEKESVWFRDYHKASHGNAREA
jgi:hypothetical protein